jgi:uncharacterized phage protein (TIGR02220 family)
MTEPLPEPLVPAEVDLRDFPFTPIFRARLFGSSFHARTSDAAWRAGVTLWLKSWDQVPAGTLPDDDIDLCRLAELGRDMKSWAKLRDTALHGWRKCTDGRLHHQVVAEGVLEAWAKRSSAKKRGGAGAAARWHKQPETMAKPSTQDGSANAQAMLGDSKGSEREVKETGKGEEKQKSIVGLAPDAVQPAKNGQDSQRMRELRSQAVSILAFLNEKTGRGYEPVPANVDRIVARLKEGTTPDDIRAVIAMKCREWSGDPKTEKWIRPKTLFSAENFANYKGELGQPEPERRLAI